jgi:hypothetical protein
MVLRWVPARLSGTSRQRFALPGPARVAQHPTPPTPPALSRSEKEKSDTHHESIDAVNSWARSSILISS